MYSRGFYKGKTKEEIGEDITEEGWSPLLLSHNSGYRYEPHSHTSEKLLVMVEGSMDVRAGDQRYTLLPGDKSIIPGGIEHEATCGPQGCEFFWAER